MSPVNSIQYFLGANSPTGFYSLYDQLLPPEQASAIYILKGGPGCGKSTLMRRVAALAQEAGEPVEYIVLPGKKAALVDGTAPHDTAPLGHPAKKVRICKGLRDQLLDGTSTGHGYLGHFCRTSYLIRGVTAQK